MTKGQKQFAVLDLASLSWPQSFSIPTRRFRLLLAAHTGEIPADDLAEFAKAALNAGMVYCCTWGTGCERMHDIVDQCIVEHDSGFRSQAIKGSAEVVITTWHENDTLEEAVNFLAKLAVPSDGLLPDSGFRLVLSVRHPEWKDIAVRCLEIAEFAD